MKQTPRSDEKAVLDRIEALEEAIAKANEYLETGKHADWQGFRPLFKRKQKDGRDLPPHRDWVKNVYLPHMAKALNQAERILQRISEEPRKSDRGSK